MVSKPENHILAWTQTQADKFIFHIEATTKPQAVIDAIREADGDREIGIALNPQTPTAKLESVLDLVDFVHFMTVEPGFYGGKFVSTVVDKISDFHYSYPDKPIAVDGGVTPATWPALLEAGASTFVVGSYVFDSRNASKAIEELKASFSK